MFRTGNRKSIKPFIIIGIIASILLIGLIILIAIHSIINSATLDILVSPSSSTIYLDNHQVKNGLIKVTPGTHTIKAEKPGFESQSIEVTANRGQTTQGYIILTSNDSSTANWFNEHEDDQKVIEQIVGREFEKESDTFTADYPVIEFLPYETKTFSVGYGQCDDNDFCIIMDAFGYSYDGAIDYLKSKGVDLGKYYYKYVDRKNPFLNLKMSTDIKNRQNISLDNKAEIESYVKNLLNSSTVKNIVFTDNFALLAVNYQIEPGVTTIYRLIIEKAGNDFVLLTTPEPILTYAKYPDIPEEVIRQANNL